jgi:hypothetical protein
MKNVLTTVTLLCLLTGVSLNLHAQRRNISVSNFSEISMGTSGTIYVTQGNETKVEVVASDERMENLEIEVNGDKLVIRTKGNWGWNKNSGDLDIYVVTPNINGLSVSGSGKMIVQNKIKTNDLDMSVSGSGKLVVGADARKMDISISGSGNVELSGSAEAMEASISGSGDVHGEDLRVGTVDITISGSGSCEIHVNETLDARISGSGSIRYSGNPKHVNSKSSGSGSVKKIG